MMNRTSYGSDSRFRGLPVFPRGSVFDRGMMNHGAEAFIEVEQVLCVKLVEYECLVAGAW